MGSIYSWLGNLLEVLGGGKERNPAPTPTRCKEEVGTTHGQREGESSQPNQSGKKAKNRTNPASEWPSWFFFWSLLMFLTKIFEKYRKKHKGNQGKFLKNLRTQPSTRPLFVHLW